MVSHISDSHAIINYMWQNLRGLPGRFLAYIMYIIRAHPTLKALALNCVCRYPILQEKLYKFDHARGMIAGGTTMQISELSRLTPNAYHIYSDLKIAIERRNKEDQ
jgi:hypothetical protein